MKKTDKSLARSIVMIVLLLIGLTVTTYALMSESLSIKEHNFTTGKMKINLNDGKTLQFKDVNGNPIAYFEPGMTFKSDFFVRNDGSNDMYYKIYFDQVSGDLVNVLSITIKDGDRTIFTGNMKDMDKTHTKAVDDVLSINEQKTLTIIFTFDKNADNRYMSKELTFALMAEGTQVRNNPNKEFNE